jgi:hypothetical protein
MRHRAVLPHPGIAFRLDGGAALAGNGGRHTAAVRQMSVRGVHDRVHRQAGDVAPADFQDAPAAQTDAFHDFRHFSSPPIVNKKGSCKNCLYR